MRRRWLELAGAVTLLTRLPAYRLAAQHPPPGACAWAYPLVGGAIGAVGAMVLMGAVRAGLPQPLAAAWALAATALLTGGLHEDGLADTADGLGGGGTRERKLAIMRDSNIGSFGALALLLSVALRLIPLATTPRPARALVLAAVFGRAAMLVPLVLLRPARSDGLAASLAAAGRGRGLAGLILAGAAAWFAPGAGLAALLAGLAVAALARAQIGGYTGDIFGAAEQVAECAALSCLV